MTSLNEYHANVWRSHRLGRVVGHYGAIDAIGAACCLRCVVSWYELSAIRSSNESRIPGLAKSATGLDWRD